MDKVKDIIGHITDRVQKLTSALYKVTDLMSDKEPIKWTLREKAVNIHDSLMSISSAKDKNRLIGDILDNSYQVIKSLELAANGTFISNLNFEILKREYVYLKNFLEGKKNDLYFDQKILPEFMPHPLAKTGEKNILGYDNSDNFRLGKRGLISSKNDSRELFSENDLSAEIEPQSRKGKILGFLKSGEAKTVSEIAAIFNGGASDKSVQRDLFDLVRLGKVAAQGDKRWRKYEIIKETSVTA